MTEHQITTLISVMPEATIKDTRGMTESYLQFLVKENAAKEKALIVQRLKTENRA